MLRYTSENVSWFESNTQQYVVVVLKCKHVCYCVRPKIKIYSKHWSPCRSPLQMVTWDCINIWFPLRIESDFKFETKVVYKVSFSFSQTDSGTFSTLKQVVLNKFSFMYNYGWSQRNKDSCVQFVWSSFVIRCEQTLIYVGYSKAYYWKWSKILLYTKFYYYYHPRSSDTERFYS